MTYIRELDPQWHDPALDEPFTCGYCGQAGTMEDFMPVTSATTTGVLCPWCGAVSWDEP